MKHRISILGGGESGVGAAFLADKKGYSVFLSDYGKIADKYKKILEETGIDWEEDKHSYDKIVNADEIIKSPGIPDKSDIIKRLKNTGIPIISEIEFASRYTQAKKICVTGSNGKTTTSELIYHILKKAKLNVGLAGNVGYSFAMQVAKHDYAYYVLELSSFQLDYMFYFKADIAILLNITPDHLDWYNYDFSLYANSKFRITNNQDKNCYFIYNEDDSVITDKIKELNLEAKMLPFSINKALTEGGYIDNTNLIINYKNTFAMDTNDLSLEGKHNMYNSLASGISAKVLNIKKTDIRESLSNFEGIEHRLEKFIKVRGILFINDSKSTNVNSSWYALESIKKRIVWIAGGIDKGNDYSILNDLVYEKVKVIVALGEDNSKLHTAFDNTVGVIDTHSMEDAVKAAFLLAENDDVVLLSPACASFDLFENYQDRGRKFKEEVRKL